MRSVRSVLDDPPSSFHLLVRRIKKFPSFLSRKKGVWKWWLEMVMFSTSVPVISFRVSNVSTAGRWRPLALCSFLIRCANMADIHVYFWRFLKLPPPRPPDGVRRPFVPVSIKVCTKLAMFGVDFLRLYVLSSPLMMMICHPSIFFYHFIILEL